MANTYYISFFFSHIIFLKSQVSKQVDTQINNQINKSYFHICFLCSYFKLYIRQLEDGDFMHIANFGKYDYVKASFWGSLFYLSGSLTAEQMILMQKVLHKFLIKTETQSFYVKAIELPRPVSGVCFPVNITFERKTLYVFLLL